MIKRILVMLLILIVAFGASSVHSGKAQQYEIIITEPLQIIRLEGIALEYWACTGTINGYVFNHPIPAEYTTNIDTAISYLSSEGAAILVAAVANADDVIEPLYLSPDSLPHSQHIAKIKSICLSCAKPLTVTRKWMGELFDIDCLVSQSIVELYQMGNIAVGDYVVVSFIDEFPEGQEVNIPVAVDKVYVSWD